MQNWKLKLLYDGACPVCRRTADWLKRRNRRLLLTFEDISDPQFDPGRHGLTREEVNRVLHGILPNGKVICGMAAIRRAARAVGLGWLTVPTALPGMRWATDRLYLALARRRSTRGPTAGQGCTHGACSP